MHSRHNSPAVIMHKHELSGSLPRSRVIIATAASKLACESDIDEHYHRETMKMSTEISGYAQNPARWTHRVVCNPKIQCQNIARMRNCPLFVLKSGQGRGFVRDKRQHAENAHPCHSQEPELLSNSGFCCKKLPAQKGPLDTGRTQYPCHPAQPTKAAWPATVDERSDQI